MKHIFSIILFFLPLLAIAQFEGQIDIKEFDKATGEDLEMSWLVKNGNTLMQTQSTTKEHNIKYDVLLKKGESNLYLLSEPKDRKAYMIPQGNMKKKNIHVPLNSIMIPQGNTEINGQKSEKFKIQTDKTSIDIWIGEDSGVFQTDLHTLIVEKNPLYDFVRLQGKKGLILKYEIRDLSGEIVNSFEVKKITATTVDASKVSVPKNYEMNKL